MTFACFYYPFFGEIFQTVIDRIVTSIDRHPRLLTIIFSVPRKIAGVPTTGPELEAYLVGTGRFAVLRRHRLALGRPNHSITIYTSTS